MQTEIVEQHAALNAFIASLQLKYTWRFVPQSQSRNAKDKQPTLNWTLRIAKGERQALELEYSQGIAHVPGYNHGRRGSHAMWDWRGKQIEAAESGKYPANNPLNENFYTPHLKPLPPPALRDVLYSLILDSSVIDYASFEDWAGDFGYDPDSRKGEAIYRACLAHAIALRAMLGDAALAELKEQLQDY